MIEIEESGDGDSRRCTDEGITIVALDPRGRGLHRARPERGRPLGRLAQPGAARTWFLVAVLALAVVAVAATQLG